MTLLQRSIKMASRRPEKRISRQKGIAHDKHRFAQETHLTMLLSRYKVRRLDVVECAPRGPVTKCPDSPVNTGYNVATTTAALWGLSRRQRHVRTL
ncbi:MAG: hypothetical protein EKK47_22400 [Burkholderiales bacterium]|nr:MAG: hypothetical protein EKK47_22400 [Burkholderiales bacterium]